MHGIRAVATAIPRHVGGLYTCHLPLKGPFKAGDLRGCVCIIIHCVRTVQQDRCTASERLLPQFRGMWVDCTHVPLALERPAQSTTGACPRALAMQYGL